MNDTNDDLHDAGRLLQFALQPSAVPERSEEYSRLIEKYLDRTDFREDVRRIADGLGLLIVGEPRRNRSLILAPQPESVFAIASRDYRAAQNYTTEKRLIDGLIHVAIAACVYPRDADLLEDLRTSRRSVTIDEIEKTLRQIVERLEEASRNDPDPLAGEEGLSEAWRIYKSFRETSEGNRALLTTRKMIEKAFENLCDRRCFRKDGKTYQPLPRYQILVQEHAASQIHQAVKRALGTDGENL